MQARIGREGEVIVVHLSGRLDVETAEPFREACLNHLNGKKVVFDFRGLSFVGSSGILPFLETMQEYANCNGQGFKFSGVGSEFRKVFAATPLNTVDIFESPDLAVKALLNPQSSTLVAVAVQAAPTNIDVMLAQSAGIEVASVKANFGFLSLRPPVPEAEGDSIEELDE